MARLRVIQPGFQTTIQDLGRFGYTHFGVSASGAADPLSLRLGNRILGNDPGAPALEMTLVGGEFELEARTLLTVTGSDFTPTVDGQAVPLWTSILAQKGQIMRFGATRDGARCYLCIHGGLQVAPVMGSASTHLFSGVGGWHGRALQKGDAVPYSSYDGDDFPSRRFPVDSFFHLEESILLRFTEGVQWERFSCQARYRFITSCYEVSEEANRMGLRLSGPPVFPLTKEDMITEGVSLGAVQISPDGQPIILFVEHQTTGGYPKIANVISADMHRIGQLRPRNRVRFQCVSLSEAWSILREAEELIDDGYNTMLTFCTSARDPHFLVSI